MNQFQFALLVGTILTAAISLHLPRANLWILAGAMSFILSTAYGRYDLPFPPAFTLSCDAAVCLLIYFSYRERWEEYLFRIFQLSTLISLVYLAGPISFGDFTVTMSHYAYVVMLELCNWAALLVVSGTAIAEWMRGHEGGAGVFGNSRVRRPRLAWRSARSTAPFHKVKR